MGTEYDYLFGYPSAGCFIALPPVPPLLPCTELVVKTIGRPDQCWCPKCQKIEAAKPKAWRKRTDAEIAAEVEAELREVCPAAFDAPYVTRPKRRGFRAWLLGNRAPHHPAGLRQMEVRRHHVGESTVRCLGEVCERQARSNSNYCQPCWDSYLAGIGLRPVGPPNRTLPQGGTASTKRLKYVWG